MGRRSRQRAVAPASPPPRPHVVARSRRARSDEAPRAPWSPFPLVELCVLLAIVLIVAGLLTDGARRGPMLACGFALASLAGLELSVREHFSGFRSHSALLGGVCAVLVCAALFFFSGLPQVALLVAGVVVFALAFGGLHRAFQARSGGVGFRA